MNTAKIEVRNVSAKCLKRDPYGPLSRSWEVFWVAAEQASSLLSMDGADRASATGNSNGGYFGDGKSGALINIARETPAWAACTRNGQPL